MKRFAFLSLVVGSLLLVSAGAVSAGDDADNARVPLYYAGQNPVTCPSYAPSGSPVSGFVNAHQTGGTLTVTVHLRDAAPYTTYTVDVRCQTARIGSITTNANGVGNGTFQTYARIGTFAIDAYNSTAFIGGQPSQVFISAPITLN